MKRAIQQLKTVGKMALLQSAFLIGAFGVEAAEQLDPEHLIASLNARLDAAETPADSIPIIYDILDLTPPDMRLDGIRELYGAATRAGNRSVQFDMLRQMANYGAKKHNVDLVNEALQQVERLPDSEEQRQSRTFILASKASARTYKSDAERSAALRQSLRIFNDLPENSDLYERAASLFGIVESIGYESQGELLSEYIDLLDKLVTEIPPLPNNFLRSKFNSIAAQAYWNNQEYQKSIKADRSQLLNLSQLLKLYRAGGRFYKHFDVQRYLCLRRILRNYELLSSAEIKDYHNQVLEITRRNPEVAADYQSDPTSRLGLLVNSGKYDEALRHAKYLADNARTIRDRHHALRQLVNIAHLAGDTDALADAEKRYAEVRKKFDAYRTDELVRELQIRYDVNAMRRQHAAVQLKRERTRNMTLVIIGGCLLALAFLLLGLYLRERRRNRRLRARNAELKANCKAASELQEELNAAREKYRRAETDKVQLVSYIGHELITPLNAIIDYSQMIVENVRDDAKEYLRHFATILDVNARIIKEVASDVQDLSVLDNNSVPVHRIPVDANVLGEMTVESIKPQLKPGVTASFTPNPGDDNVVATDPRRVQIVLLSTMANMARMIDSGNISLTVKIDRKGGTGSFFMDCDGISDKEALTILDNRERFDPEARIAGLGLPNCHMFLDALQGTLRIDGTHSGPGIRIILTIPDK